MGAVSYASDEKQYDSSKIIIGYDGVAYDNEDFFITQDISQYEIAKREGRILVNPDLRKIPDGVYTVIVTEDGDYELGKIEDDVEIGVKHFQQAQGRALYHAGEVSKYDGVYRGSIMSGTFSKKLKKEDGYSEPETMRKMEKAYRDLWNVDLKMELVTLYDDPEEISLKVLVKFCQYPEFFKYHTQTICAEFKSLKEAQCALRTGN